MKNEEEGEVKAVGRHPLEAYADSYAQMSRMGDGRIDCRSVEEDIRQNMIPVTQALTHPAPASPEDERHLFERNGEWFWLDETGQESSPCATETEARARLHAHARYLDFKWFDPECGEKGCQSLVWKSRYESAVKGRSDFRQAYREARAASAVGAVIADARAWISNNIREGDIEGCTILGKLAVIENASPAIGEIRALQAKLAEIRHQNEVNIEYACREHPKDNPLPPVFEVLSSHITDRLNEADALAASLASCRQVEWIADREMIAQAASDHSLSDSTVRQLCLAKPGQITEEIKAWASSVLPTAPAGGTDNG